MNVDSVNLTPNEFYVKEQRCQCVHGEPTVKLQAELNFFRLNSLNCPIVRQATW